LNYLRMSPVPLLSGHETVGHVIIINNTSGWTNGGKYENNNA